jgi:osmotically-inducible protein OsmY
MNRLLIPACLVFLGCTKTESPTAVEASIARAGVISASLISPASPVAENPADAMISDRVRDALLAENSSRQELGNVHVSTKDGVVTLSGSVRNEAIAWRMGAVAQAVGSVVRVVNQLVIDPNAPTNGTLESTLDHVISDRVRHALEEETLLGQEARNIGVTTKEGVVTLTGAVSNITVKQRAGVVATAVGSVVRVDNQILVKRE